MIKSNAKVNDQLDKYPTTQPIGGVTTGQFSFSEGQGYAMGVLSVRQVYELAVVSDKESRGKPNFVLVRDVNGMLLRPAQFELIA